MEIVRLWLDTLMLRVRGCKQIKYQFVIQWPGDLLSDYDLMIATEERLEAGLSKRHQVDGHDVGSGEVNVFIHTQDPRSAFEEVRRILQTLNRWNGVRIAYRDADGGKYSVLWPEGLQSFAVL